MAATLRLTHKTIGVEVRRGTYEVVLDGEHAGSLELNDPIEISVEPGRHTLQVRSGRNSSRIRTFDAAEGEIVAFRCGGKRILPIFLASFAVSQPGTLTQTRVDAASQITAQADSPEAPATNREYLRILAGVVSEARSRISVHAAKAHRGLSTPSTRLTSAGRRLARSPPLTGGSPNIVGISKT